MVVAKELTKTDPKDDKILAQSICLSKSDKPKLIPLKNTKEEEVTEPRPTPKLKEGTPT